MEKDPPVIPAGTLIAFDFGERRIGVAVGQSITGTASPLCTLVRRSDSEPNWREIEALVRTWKPKAAIVGLPLNMDGSEQRLGALARRFAEALHERTGLAVHLCDERLTTREAWERLIEGRSRRHGPDPLAAQIILESWFAAAGEQKSGADE
ncbi:MAG: Holliday junction resolvase RuvX [Ectothiorhodospiraceae bacterium AqS1]|nr:Holliday junction resolvase RuvX [Ectothiorhodospiraceae bacterium AqS1]|eukprot:XP_019862179.1 PREDICTED: uncharacterized protein LOC109590741 [Amphimedon queenslandica]